MTSTTVPIARIDPAVHKAVIEIPGLRTVNELNSCGNRFVNARRRKHHRQVTAYYMLTKPVPPMPATVKLTRIGNGIMDDDNLAGSLKSVRDSIADCYGINDRDMKFVYDQEKAKRYAVRITITAQGGNGRAE